MGPQQQPREPGGASTPQKQAGTCTGCRRRASGWRRGVGGEADRPTAKGAAVVRSPRASLAPPPRKSCVGAGMRRANGRRRGGSGEAGRSTPGAAPFRSLCASLAPPQSKPCCDDSRSEPLLAPGSDTCRRCCCWAAAAAVAAATARCRESSRGAALLYGGSELAARLDGRPVAVAPPPLLNRGGHGSSCGMDAVEAARCACRCWTCCCCADR